MTVGNNEAYLYLLWLVKDHEANFLFAATLTCDKAAVRQTLGTKHYAPGSCQRYSRVVRLLGSDYLLDHLYAHVSAPVVILQPVNPATTTFTLTSTSNTGFRITASASDSLTVNHATFDKPN